MKIWLKLLIGITLGIILGIVLPAQDMEKFFADAAEIILQVGRYIIYPLVFFSLIIGTYELQQQKKLMEVYGKIVIFLLATTAILITIGIVSVLIFSPDPISTKTNQIDNIDIMGLKEVLLSSFPNNFFEIFTGKGNFLLPIMIAAVIIGFNLSFDKVVTRPVVQLIDSLSRIFYQIASFIAEIFWVGLVAIMVSTFYTLKGVPDYTDFKQLLIILTIDSVVILFGLYPLLVYLLGERKNPYKWLYSITGPLLTAFTTGDEYLSIGMLTIHGKENMGVSRPINSTVYPIFSLCGRAGTAMVASITIFILIKSQSSLNDYINIETILWIAGYSFMVAFILGSMPGKGAFVAVALLCAQYERGIQEFYLIVKDIAPILIAFGVLLDVATSAFTSFLITHKKKVKQPLEAKNFI